MRQKAVDGFTVFSALMRKGVSFYFCILMMILLSEFEGFLFMYTLA